MQRVSITPRNNWQQKVEKLGFIFHTGNIPYWDESAYYEFTMPEVLAIERATERLWDMCLEAVGYVIENNLYSHFHVPPHMIPEIVRSWEQDVPSIYGRFDFSFKDGVPKLLEFNADTPTSLFEAAVVQWFWLKDFNESKDQFNSIHEKLIGYWKILKDHLHTDTLHFSCINDSMEDFTTTEYLRDCAIQAGLKTNFIFINDIGWDERSQRFADLENREMKNIFKLYPWEWISNEAFGANIPKVKNDTIWIEPAWKMLLSTKAILPVLWQLFSDSPYLLATYYEPHDGMKDYAKKPILSREGANIEIVSAYVLIEKTEGDYGEEGYVYQELCQLPDYSGNYPLVGSWIIGQQPAGMGIRESTSLITSNSSRFLPHLIA
jgi:glutathionylspermidine synthase